MDIGAKRVNAPFLTFLALVSLLKHLHLIHVDIKLSCYMFGSSV